MAKKTKEELVETVLGALDGKKNTVNEIAAHIGSNWSTVKETLDFLEKYGIITHYMEKNNKIYVKKSAAKKVEGLSGETLFNLPVTQKQKNMAHSLFGFIQEEYKKYNANKPGKILTQKVIEDLEAEHKIDVPGGWYLFGLTTIVAYDPLIDYPINLSLVSSELRKNISNLTREYTKLKTADDIMYHQYKKHSNKLYLAKWNLSKLSSDRINFKHLETKQALQKYLSDFLLYLPHGKHSDELEDIVNRYVITMNKLLLGGEDLNLIKPQLSIAFSVVWKYVASVNFYNDLSKFYNKIDLEHLESKIHIAKQDALEQITFISEFYSPPEKLPTLGIELPEEELLRSEFVNLTKD